MHLRLALSVYLTDVCLPVYWIRNLNPLIQYSEGTREEGHVRSCARHAT
jgi:hypothetical protein